MFQPALPSLACLALLASSVAGPQRHTSRPQSQPAFVDRLSGVPRSWILAPGVVVLLPTQEPPVRTGTKRVLGYPRGFDLLRTAVGGVQDQRALLVRMRDLAREASSGVLNTSARAEANASFQLGMSLVERIAQEVRYEDIELLDGSEDVCLETSSGGELFVDLPETSAQTLGLGVNLCLLTVSSASIALVQADRAIQSAVEARVALLEAAAAPVD